MISVVLYIEDDAGNVRLVERILRQAGFIEKPFGVHLFLSEIDKHLA